MGSKQLAQTHCCGTRRLARSKGTVGMCYYIWQRLARSWPVGQSRARQFRIIRPQRRPICVQEPVSDRRPFQPSRLRRTVPFRPLAQGRAPIGATTRCPRPRRPSPGRPDARSEAWTESTGRRAAPPIPRRGPSAHRVRRSASLPPGSGRPSPEASRADRRSSPARPRGREGPPAPASARRAGLAKPDRAWEPQNSSISGTSVCAVTRPRACASTWRWICVT